MRLSAGRILHLPGLQAGAENAREIAHVLGDEEVVLHEAFDMLQAAMRLVAEPLGDLGLAVEAQPVVAALRQEVQVAAHRPEKVLALLEDRQLLAGEGALLGELVGGVGGVEELGDPEQRVEIAQAALAILHVGLDQIAALARP